MAVRWNFSNIPGDAVSVVSATGTSMRLHKFNIIGDSKNGELPFLDLLAL